MEDRNNDDALLRNAKSRQNRGFSGNSSPDGDSVPPVPNFVRVGQQHRQNQPFPDSPSKANKNEKEEPIPMKKSGFDILKLLNFKNLNIDSDVILIMVLIFLLSSQESDELLLLALVYILL